MAYGLYDGSIESIPGLGGWTQQQKITDQRNAQGIRDASGVMGLIQAAKAQQDDAKIREALTAGGAPEQVLMNLAKVGPAGLATANHYMSAMKALQENKALTGLDLTNPDAVERAAIATGHAGLTGLAEKLRQRQADVATQKTLMSQATPITETPTMGVQNGAPAYRSAIPAGGPVVPAGSVPGTNNGVTEQRTTEPVPPEVLAAIQAGKPFSVGVGPSSKPAENTQQTGGLFESLMNSPIEAIRGQAVNSQRQVDSADPLSVRPQHWIDMQGKLAGQESTQMMTQAMMGRREGMQERGIEARRDNILLANGINPDGSLNESGMQMAHAISTGQLPPLTGAALIRPGGRAIMSQVMTENPKYEAQQYGVSFATEKGFTSGKQGTTIKSFNTAIDHLATLGELADALHNGDTQLVNKIGNYIAVQTGQPAPNNFEAAKQIVGDEIVKAIVGAGGGVADREKAQAAISGAASPEQLKEVIATYRKLMGGQLHGIYQQYVSGGGKKDFNSFLTEESQAVANIPSNAQNQVTLPGGQVKVFPSPAAAQAFKKAAGIE